MNNFIAVRFPDSGLTYEVAAGPLMAVIAGRVAKANPLRPAGEYFEQIARTMDDPQAFRNAARALEWTDVLGCARLIEYNRPAGLGSMSAAEWSAGYDEPRKATLPDPSEQGIAPLDLHLSVMCQLGAKVSAQVFHDSAGVVSGAMIFVGGDKEQVDAYLSVCAQLCKQLTDRPEGAPVTGRPTFNH